MGAIACVVTWRFPNLLTLIDGKFKFIWVWHHYILDGELVRVIRLTQDDVTYQSAIPFSLGPNVTVSKQAFAIQAEPIRN